MQGFKLIFKTKTMNIYADGSPSISCFLVLLLFLIFSCEESSVNIVNDNLIFSGSNEILVPGYSYISGTGRIFMISGDEGFENDITDTVNNTPVIEWDSASVKSQTVVAAIFNDAIKTDQAGIINGNNIVWLWHTGVPDGNIGQVSFNDGYSIQNNDIENKSPPVPLTGDHIYYWGVWAFDVTGTKIISSSKMFKFYVE